MSDRVRGVVVAHGSLAAALVGEAERISGEHDGLIPVSNSDCGPEDIERRVAEAVGRRAGGGLRRHALRLLLLRRDAGRRARARKCRW